MIAYAHAQRIVDTVSSNLQHFSEAVAEQLISSGWISSSYPSTALLRKVMKNTGSGETSAKPSEHISLLVKRKERWAARTRISAGSFW